MSYRSLRSAEFTLSANEECQLIASLYRIQYTLDPYTGISNNIIANIEKRFTSSRYLLLCFLFYVIVLQSETSDDWDHLESAILLNARVQYSIKPVVYLAMVGRRCRNCLTNMYTILVVVVVPRTDGSMLGPFPARCWHEIFRTTCCIHSQAFIEKQKTG